jgi:heme exporter protein B
VRGTVSALIRKDLALERRAFESVPAMLMFSISTFVLFHFGLDRSSLAGDLASGVLWVTLLLAAVLGMNRLFVAEREQGGFDGFLMAPVDRTALFVAKAAVLFGFLVAVELVAVPAFVILLLEPGIGQALPELVAVLLLADVALALLSKAAPALNIFSLGFPVKIMLTLALLGLTFPLLPPALDALMETAVGAMTAFRSG